MYTLMIPEGKMGVFEIHSCIFVQLYRNAACTGVYVCGMVWYGYENQNVDGKSVYGGRQK